MTRPGQVSARQASLVWLRVLNPLTPLCDLYRHRELLRQFVRREIEGRYRGSNLGLLWSLVNPLLMLGIYTFVFSTVFNARWRPQAGATHGDFAITLFAGLIAFNVFAECVNRAPTLIVSNPNYVKKVVFPLQILPATAVGAALFHGMINAGILAVGNLVVRGAVPLTTLFLPVVALPLVAFSLGFAWLLASLGVYLRDTAYAVGIATQLLFFVTPILYPLDAVPPRMRPVLAVNPLATVVESFRRTLVWNQGPEWTAWCAVTLVSLVVFTLGYAWFVKTRGGFADVL